MNTRGRPAQSTDSHTGASALPPLRDLVQQHLGASALRPGWETSGHPARHQSERLRADAITGDAQVPTEEATRAFTQRRGSTSWDSQGTNASGGSARDTSLETCGRGCGRGVSHSDVLRNLECILAAAVRGKPLHHNWKKEDFKTRAPRGASDHRARSGGEHLQQRSRAPSSPGPAGNGLHPSPASLALPGFGETAGSSGPPPPSRPHSGQKATCRLGQGSGGL